MCNKIIEVHHWLRKLLDRMPLFFSLPILPELNAALGFSLLQLPSILLSSKYLQYAN